MVIFHPDQGICEAEAKAFLSQEDIVVEAIDLAGGKLAEHA